MSHDRGQDDGVDLRAVDEDGYAAWTRACHRGFLRSAITDEDLALSPSVLEMVPGRVLGAYDGDRCVGTFRTFSRELTAPGGGLLTACAVSSVTVTATHRRRGLLGRMMARELPAARDRGEAVAILIAAEYPIYGRFGFGPATWTTEWTVDVPRTGLGRYEPPRGGRVDLAEAAEVRAAGPALHDRFRRSVPGAISRDARWWQVNTGEIQPPIRQWRDPFYALYRDDSGRVDGLLVYTVEDIWEGKLPQCPLTVRHALAATPEAERALWHYALSVDWTAKLHTGPRPPDDVLPLLLGDPRAAQVTTHGDYMWLRVLDVPAALRARSYGTTGSLVLRIHDEAGIAGGRYELNASTEPGASEVRTTTRDADLAMDVRELAALYLGDESVVRLATLGRIEELTPGAAARADLLTRTSRRPWCPDMF
ncbi:GNAT family N-acetyltransferase [Streptomyces sp. PTM05]|uniref:GNAT family N-acetyltransferase n=1 Tax=Streptantibioticus parmotrematis TaxID=2873249 RepID=A0ABS7QPC1_9ACTN|nr:GNAT family N-acetyltransferase [Streptantibioticus parmotrematis]MBY8885041.1 GNAT family N-acetyltransferase [Streptantibioticus parmotrematis]